MSAVKSVEQKREERRRFMLEGNLLKVIPVIALPQVVTMLIDSLYNMADTYFVSQLGKAATAAVGVNDSLMMIIRAVSLGFGMGASSYISRQLGAKNHEEASRAASTTIMTAMGVVGVIAVIAYIFRHPLVMLLGATETSSAYSIEYASWILLSAPFTAASVCLSQTLRAEGSTTYSMIGSVSGCIINIFLDPFFISVMGLGVAGAAIATGISKFISVMLLMMPYWKRKCVIDIKPKYFTPKIPLYSEIAKMGIPTMLRTSLMSVSTIIINNMAGSFGDAALAAVSVANKSLRFVGSAVMGFGQGFQPIAGFCWGAKKYKRVKKAFYLTTLIGVVLCTILGTGLFTFAEQAITIFSKDVDVMDIAILLIRSQCIVLPMHVWVMIATGLFQALGKPFQAGFLGLCRQAFSLIPCVLILTYMFGLTGLSVAQAASDVVSFCFALALVIPMMKEINNLRQSPDAVE